MDRVMFQPSARMKVFTANLQARCGGTVPRKNEMHELKMRPLWQPTK